MYLPDPQRAVREWLRVLKPGGRVVMAIWGKRVNCGWSPVFPIVDAEVESDVCPLFFSLGEPDALAQLCSDVGFENVQQRRIATMLKLRRRGRSLRCRVRRRPGRARVVALRR